MHTEDHIELVGDMPVPCGWDAQRFAAGGGAVRADWQYLDAHAHWQWCNKPNANLLVELLCRGCSDNLLLLEDFGCVAAI